MSKLITNTVRHVDGTADNITLDSSQNVTVEGVLKTDSLRHTGASSDAVTLATDGTCTAKITNNLSNRNLIINGACNVAQRGTSQTDVSGIQGCTTVDRFKIGWGGANNIIETHQSTLTSSDAGPWAKGFRKAYKLVNGAQSSADAGDHAYIEYNIEAQDIASSGWDYTNTSSYLTLSYWVKSSVAQTFYGYIQSYDGTSQTFSISTGALSANTWKKVTVKIPGHANLQFDSNNEAGLALYIMWPYCGTDRTTSGHTLNAWQAYNSADRMPDYGTSNDDWWLQDDATFEMTGVQLEVGDVATDFEHRSYVDELARCQRYYQRFGNAVNGYNINNLYCMGHSASAVEIIPSFPVAWRAIPTATFEGTLTVRGCNDSNSDTNVTLSGQDFRFGNHVTGASGHLWVAPASGTPFVSGTCGRLYAGSTWAAVVFTAEL